MCIELHLDPLSAWLLLTLTQTISIRSVPPAYWLTSCILPYACYSGAKPGVALDYFVR